MSAFARMSCAVARSRLTSVSGDAVPLHVGQQCILEMGLAAGRLLLGEGLRDHLDAVLGDAGAFEGLPSGAVLVEAQLAHGAEQLDEPVGPADLDVGSDRQHRVRTDAAGRELEIVEMLAHPLDFSAEERFELVLRRQCRSWSQFQVVQQRVEPPRHVLRLHMVGLTQTQRQMPARRAVEAARDAGPPVEDVASADEVLDFVPCAIAECPARKGVAARCASALCLSFGHRGLIPLG